MYGSWNMFLENKQSWGVQHSAEPELDKSGIQTVGSHPTQAACAQNGHIFWGPGVIPTG